MNLYPSDFFALRWQMLLGSAFWHYRVLITIRVVKLNLNGYHIQTSRAKGLFYFFIGLPGRLFSDQGQHLPPFGVLLD
jgi:hypothetical protein